MIEIDINTCTKLCAQEISSQEDFPLITGETYGIEKGSTILHYHDYIEICYIKQGTGMYIIDGTEYSFKAGDIFIIGSNEIHLAYNDKDVIMLVILFMPGLLWSGTGYTFEMEYLQAFWEVRKSQNNRIGQNSKYYRSILESLLEIHIEVSEKKPSYKLLVKALLLQISACITRHFELDDPNGLKNTEKNYSLFLPVFSYINANYDGKIKLEDLASVVNMGVSNFSLVFKKSLGTSPMEYVNRVRIVKASQLLLNTEKKVIDVAADCGFLSLPNFIKCFKKYTGKLPKDFKGAREYVK